MPSIHNTATAAQVKTKTKTQTNIGINPDPQGLQKLLWTEIEIKLRQYLKTMIEELLEAELTARVGAESYERSARRRTYRNGSYDRKLGTMYGTVGLDVPRMRDESVEFHLFDQYARRGGSIDAAIGTLFLNGVSTKKLSKIAKELIGVDLSSSTVSNIHAAISNEGLKSFQEKELLDEYQFLFFDGISSKTKHISVERDMLLVGLGLKKDGSKEIIGARLARAESEKEWAAFLVDLKSRGLKGKAIECIAIDGCSGLKAALKSVYPFKPIQRCIAHKMRNVVAYLKRAHKKACAAKARQIWASKSRTEAIRRFKEWRDEWYDIEERAVHCLEKDLDECLTYFQFSEKYWKKIRTTNIIERTFREVRRRTRPMSIALAPKNTERLFSGIAKNLNQSWNQTNPSTNLHT